MALTSLIKLLFVQMKYGRPLAAAAAVSVLTYDVMGCCGVGRSHVLFRSSSGTTLHVIYGVLTNLCDLKKSNCGRMRTVGTCAKNNIIVHLMLALFNFMQLFVMFNLCTCNFNCF